MELKFDPDNPKYTYIDTPTKMDEALDVLEKQKVIGLDIESTSLDPYDGLLILVQVSSDKESFIFDARKIDLGKIERFKKLLENKNIIKLLHNGKFDFKYIKVKTGIDTENIYDTMLAEAILNSGIGKAYYGLKELAQLYLNINLEKQIRRSFETVNTKSVLTEEQLKYAASDTLIMFPIFEAQLEKIRKEGLMNIAKLEFATTRVVGDMELAGVYINEKKMERHNF